MSKAILSKSPEHKTFYARDDHDESGRIHVEKTFLDPLGVLERNKRNRLDATLKTGDKLAVHDGAEIVYHFRIPSVRAWAYFQKKHPDLAPRLRSPAQAVREKACAELRALKPAWVVAAPGSHHR